MAHNLNENGNRMFYVGETPWHKLGTKLNAPATAKEAIEASKLDYTVELQPIMLPSGKIITDKKASVRKDTDACLGIVSPKYKIIQNVEAFNFFDVVVGEGQAIYHTAGALGAGERIWIAAKLPGECVITKNDTVEKYLLLTTSHDGLSSLRLFFTPVRVVCQNTLNLALNDAKGVKLQHKGNLRTKVEEVREALGIAVNYYQQFEQIAKQMVDIKLDTEKVNNYFDGILGIEDVEEATTRILNQKDDLLALFEHGKGNDASEVKHSLWSAYNSVTEYVDYHKTVNNIDKDNTNKLYDMWFGTGANLKEKAYNSALQLINA